MRAVGSSWAAGAEGSLACQLAGGVFLEWQSPRNPSHIHRQHGAAFRSSDDCYSSSLGLHGAVHANLAGISWRV